MPYSWKRPQLNQTGLLKAPIWCTSMYVSSASNASASAAVAKYPPISSPALRSVCATRRTSWRTEVSDPLGEISTGTPALRKYLETATSVASGANAAGTSASSILKTTSPSAPEILAGLRVHSTSANTSAAVWPARVVRRGTARPFALRAGRGPSERGAWVDGPAGSADNAEGSVLPFLAMVVFPLTSARGCRRARRSVRRVRQGWTPCQTKPTRDCGDAPHKAHVVLLFPQVVDRVCTGPRGLGQDRFWPLCTARPPRFPCVQLVVGRPPSRKDLGVDMKTLTEFSGTMIRMAARAEAEARKNLPPELLRV